MFKFIGKNILEEHTRNRHAQAAWGVENWVTGGRMRKMISPYFLNF